MKRAATQLKAVKKVKITDFFRKSGNIVEVKAVDAVGIVQPVKEPPKTVEASSEDHKTLSKFKQEFVQKLDKDTASLLDLELQTLEDSWFKALHTELTKPYFLDLKRFLQTQRKSHKIFPPQEDVYSWSQLTPLDSVKCVILGQDPYHNDNQAHGLAFSVKEPTPPPPSLKNMYKALKLDYPGLVISQTGDLTPWAKQGVLMLNACLTVRAHEANSHAKKGWEQFTERVVQIALKQKPVVLLLWGTPAQTRVKKMDLKGHCVLKAVHPSPLSARRGFFEAQHFKKTNKWLESQGLGTIDWRL